MYSPNPVPLNQDDLHRFLSDELERIRISVDTLTEYFARIEAIATEEAILRGSTTMTGAVITNYPNEYMPRPPVLSTDPQTITMDAAAGTITIGEDGAYTIDGYVAQSNGRNNDPYAWAIMKNGVTELVLGNTVWAQQANAYVFNAHADFAFEAGDVLRIEAIDTLTNITVVASNFAVYMRTDPDENQVALTAQVWDF